MLKKVAIFSGLLVLNVVAADVPGQLYTIEDMPRVLKKLEQRAITEAQSGDTYYTSYIRAGKKTIKELYEEMERLSNRLKNLSNSQDQEANLLDQATLRLFANGIRHYCSLYYAAEVRNQGYSEEEYEKIARDNGYDIPREAQYWEWAQPYKSTRLLKFEEPLR